MTNLNLIINDYKLILQEKLQCLETQMNLNVFDSLKDILHLMKIKFINIHDGMFTFSIDNLKNDAIYNQDKVLQDKILEFILAQPLTTNSLYNLLLEIDLGNFSKSRIDALSFNSPFTKGIAAILNTKYLRDSDKQFFIEKFSIEYEFNYFKYQFDYATDNGVLIFFKNINFKLINTIDLLLSRYTVNNFKYLRKKGKTSETKLVLFFLLFDKYKLVNIIFSNLVKLISNSHHDPISKTTLCMSMADVLLKSFRYLNVPIPDNLKDFISDDEYQALFHMESVDKAQLGLIVFEFILLKLPDIFISKTITENNMSTTYINFHPDYLDRLYKEGMDVFKLPMVSPPLLWKDNSHGGYYTKVINFFNNKKLDIIHQSPLNSFESKPSSMQYDTINYLNKQAFKINLDVLNFALEEWDKPEGVFAPYNKPIIIETGGFTTKTKKYKDAQSHNSIYWIYRNILNMAILYKNTTFYLPTFMDFRGRVYPYVSYLSYQGNDLARALLMFANTETIQTKGFEYMKLYLATTFGLSSQSFAKRLDWFDANFEEFYDLYYKSPYLFYTKVVSLAKEKFQFLSVFLAILSYVDSKGKALIGLPILFDCSCSGIQHLSALCADISLAKMVNVISSEEEKSDFYSIAANYVMNLLSESKNNVNLSRLNINRTIMKIPVMTIPYNISIHGVGDKLENTLISEKVFENSKCYYKILPQYIIDDQPLVLTGKEFANLTLIIYNSVYNIVPSLKIIIEFLNNLSVLLQKINQPVIWITPSHLTINLSTKKFKSVLTKTKLTPSAKPITISIPIKGMLDKKSIQTSFIPNFIHSLDASNIHILIDILKSNNLSNIPLYTIHDCFATTPNQMENLNSLILMAFIELYFNQNYLVKLYNNIIDQLTSYGYKIKVINGVNYIISPEENLDPIELPIIPTKLLDNWERNKDFFLNNIGKSQYFIS